MTLIEAQDRYVADYVRAYTEVTTRYGNRNKALRAAAKRYRNTLTEMGFSEDAIEITLEDARDVARVELRY